MMVEEKELQGKEAGIDLSVVFQALWKRRGLFAITLSLGFVVGLAVAFGVPKTYESKAILAPEVSAASGLSSNLSDLASMVGVQIGTASGASVDAIYPELYPDIVSSSPFIGELFDIPVSTKDGRLKSISLYEYLEKHQEIPWWNKAMGGVISLFKSKPAPKPAKERQTDPLHFTMDEEFIAQAIRGMVHCSVDRKTSIITVSVTTQDPLVAAIVADSVQHRLQEYVTNYRTKKARADLAYTEKLYVQAKKDYEASQKAYSQYADANSDLLLESLITKRDELENEMQLRYNMYNQLTQQIQVAKAKVQENTPAFTQIQPAQIPVLKVGPKRGVIIAIWLMLAFFCTTIYATVSEIRQKDKKSKISLSQDTAESTLSVSE